MLPFQLGLGVKVRVDPEMEAVPCAALGAVTIWKTVGVGESMSVAVSVTVPEVSSSIVRVFGCATGGSFTGVTVMVTVATFESAPAASVALYVSEVVPYQSFWGVKIRRFPEIDAVP